uniref:regulator of microtubule dynamics protein 3 n=1 Tax=Monopterus albus TaxID=43700 RepID=UPI0009B4CD13|nr:regulator of microtubule dynamics protein 3 [Monopterus albus]
MNTPLGRNGLIGLAVGATVGLGMIALIIYREISKRRSHRLVKTACSVPLLLDETTLDAQEAEAQQQALAAVEAVVQGLSPAQQLELRNQLDQVLSCVASLRSEVAELRGGLQDIALQIIQDVKKGVEDSQRVRRRRHFIHRERIDSPSSSSIYFTASQGMVSTYEETSEGGYSTAYADSDYTDRDTDREEGRQDPEQESEEEEEDRSCATVLTLCQENSQEQEVEDDGGLEEEDDEGRLVTEVPCGELALLLAQSDILHTGDAKLKAEGFQLLLDNRAEYGDSREFLWRLARAYCDIYESTEDEQQRKAYAQQGNGHMCHNIIIIIMTQSKCHKWFAVLTGLTTQHDSMHGKLKSSHILKEHLDHAVALRDDDPMCFYLLGKWCYEVATLDWLEKKAAAAIYQSPPFATLHDALENFLKAEDLSPGFSKTVRLYIAKCHKDLGNISEATNWTELALKMPTNTNDIETTNLEAQLRI